MTVHRLYVHATIFGIFLGLILGAPSPARAESEPIITPEVLTLAEQANVDPVDLQGALHTTGQEPWDYLAQQGHLPIPAPTAAPPPAAIPGIWQRLAQCEAQGNWYVNAYHDGGLQFLPSTWNAYKPAGYPAYAYQASPAQQVYVAERVLNAAGWCQWPTCARILGLVRRCP